MRRFTRPTFNVLGSANGEPLIAIEGTDPTTEVQLDDAQSASVTAKAKPGQGQLRMVTVSEAGGPRPSELRSAGGRSSTPLYLRSPTTVPVTSARCRTGERRAVHDA